jgi:hypothetical protein
MLVRLSNPGAASVWTGHVVNWWSWQPGQTLLGASVDQQREDVGPHPQGDPDAVLAGVVELSAADTAA